MRTTGRLLASVVMAGMVVGLALGAVGVGVRLGHPAPAGAANGDRFEEYVMCTGACAVSPRAPTDGVWLLDYRAGKLLGTVIDRTSGKIVGFAEVDLANEFKVQPKSNVHFLMTTGTIAQGQAALYLAETTTGKFGVYTLAPGDGSGGITIQRHDMVMFRKAG
jgi:hypothetical protein